MRKDSTISAEVFGSDGTTHTSGPAFAALSDAELVERARGADATAFEELIRRNYGLVFSVCRGVCGREADAEDAAQDTFVRAWRALPTFRADSAFSTWLYRIATNVSLSLVTRRKDTAAETVPERADLSSSPEGQVEGLERVGVVRRALDDLSDDARAAFVLRDVNGLSYDEIAETLEISLSAVKSRIFRARQAVADALAAHDGEVVS